jgi:acetyl esterase/lipase
MPFDSVLFDPESISKETAEFNQLVHEAISQLPPTYTFPPQQLRDDREAGKGLWPVERSDEMSDRKITALGRTVPVRVFVPEQVDGVYLHIHGGGFMLGRAHHSDISNVAIGKSCNLVVVSVDYRLAPENPYPAGADDCESAAVWLVENMKREFGAEKVLIGGESAGGNLAAVTLLRMRDRHGFSGFSGANLIYGVFDLTSTPSSRSWGEERKYVLTTRLIDWFHENYIPEGDYSRDDPELSPIYHHLHDMPPALFTVGTLDPLLDDSLFMHARWAAAGNKGNLAIYPGGIHAFNAFPIQLARDANDRVMVFLRYCLM